jgi:hypothetical protein
MEASMNQSMIRRGLCGLIFVACLVSSQAQAQITEAFVSRNGADTGNNCATMVSPCRSLQRAHDQVTSGGQVTILDTGEFFSVEITKSIAIINDSGGTVATVDNAVAPTATEAAPVVIIAGPNDVVTLRGLTLNPSIGASAFHGVVVNNARQVNIQNCTILNALNGILVTPSTLNHAVSLTSAIGVKIQDTTLAGNGTGLRITGASGVAVNAVVNKTQIDGNSGGGIRADTSGGGSTTIDLVDSSVSLNGGNGINAIAGGGQNIVSIKNSVIARNGAAGLQANGANAGVLVATTLLDQNAAGATSVVNGGNMFTYGDNQIVGSFGSGFTATAALH